MCERGKVLSYRLMPYKRYKFPKRVSNGNWCSPIVAWHSYNIITIRTHRGHFLITVCVCLKRYIELYQIPSIGLEFRLLQKYYRQCSFDNTEKKKKMILFFFLNRVDDGNGTSQKYTDMVVHCVIHRLHSRKHVRSYSTQFNRQCNLGEL